MTSAANPERTLERARERLLAERTPGGWWKGELSSSALSTATACAALALGGHEEDQPRLETGLAWLAQHQNEDGGFGDTTCSPSNLSTTALGWMALGLASGQHGAAQQRAGQWLHAHLGGLGPEHLARGLREVYAEDRTFAVPILVACTVGGAFDEDAKAWPCIPHLPYELAAFPRRLFKWLGLSVVSYALPALIAIGQVIEHHRPSRNPLTRALRAATRASTLRTLARIQPEGGGFLEATPLTSFVVLSLIACSHQDHQVVRSGLGFLRRSQRADGSWPIDTDLATWLTTLSVGALAGGGKLRQSLDVVQREALSSWLVAQQQCELHPYTGAAPGGWAWTNAPGGVPDADDTPGAILALNALGTDEPNRKLNGALWLRDLQNRDGGIPTFCRGWGKLPFDASCPDLTAHALRAWRVCGASELRDATRRAQRHLVRTQREDGSWIPLWFGNQSQREKLNPVYGTSRVLRAVEVEGDEDWRISLRRGLAWLVSAQNDDGGFGGDAQLNSSIEETGLALEALAEAAQAGLGDREAVRGAIEAGVAYLARATAEGTSFEARPIGLYFAQLWYSERLYPLIFSVSALERCLPVLAEERAPVGASR